MTPADLFNIGQEFEWRGQTYRVKKLGVEQMFVFGEWLANRAKLSAMRTKDAPDEFVKLQLSVVNSDVAAGLYEPGGEYYAKACYTLVGAAKVLSLALEGGHPDMTEERCLEWLQERAGELLSAAADAAGDGGKASSAQEAPSPPGPTASGGASSTAAPGGATSGGSRRGKSRRSTAAS